MRYKAYKKFKSTIFIFKIWKYKPLRLYRMRTSCYRAVCINVSAVYDFTRSMSIALRATGERDTSCPYKCLLTSCRSYRTRLEMSKMSQIRASSYIFVLLDRAEYFQSVIDNSRTLAIFRPSGKRPLWYCGDPFSSRIISITDRAVNCPVYLPCVAWILGACITK